MRRRWSPASKLLLVLAVASGVASFVLVRGYVARIEATRPDVGAPVPVVVAARPIARGAVLSETELQVRDVPSAFAPPGALGSIDQAVGRTLSSDLAEGEAVTRTRLGAVGSGPIASLVPTGLRAFAVQGDIPAGSVRQGDLVDVLATFGGPHPHTEIIAEGLEVLLVLGGDPAGSSGPLASTTGVGFSGEHGPTLVLLVSPDQAERLAYAKAFAELAIAIEAPHVDPTAQTASG